MKVVARRIESGPFECEPRGKPAPELVEAIVGLIDLKTRGRHGPVERVMRVDVTDVDALHPVLASEVTAVAIDARSERGMMVVTHGPATEYFCICVSTRRDQTTVNLDLYMGIGHYTRSDSVFHDVRSLPSYRSCVGQFTRCDR